MNIFYVNPQSTLNEAFKATRNILMQTKINIHLRILPFLS